MNFADCVIPLSSVSTLSKSSSTRVYVRQPTVFVIDVLLKNRDFFCTYWGFRGMIIGNLSLVCGLRKHQFGFDSGDEKRNPTFQHHMWYGERNWTIYSKYEVLTDKVLIYYVNISMPKIWCYYFVQKYCFYINQNY